MHNGRMSQMILEFSFACGLCLLAALFAPLSLWRDLGQAGGSLLAGAVAVIITGGVWLRSGQPAQPVEAEAFEAMVLGPAK